MSDHHKIVAWGLLGVVIVFFNISPSCSTSSDRPPVYHYKVIHVYPHDPNAFTQGLVFEGGVLYEGTGGYQQSSLRKVDLETGAVLQIQNLSEDYFGEGLTVYDNQLIQLTWRSNIGFVYDTTSFKVLDEFTYTTEGWGLTHDDQYLIMSDGSASLYFLDPKTFAPINQLNVYDHEGPVSFLNELEYIQGEIWANVWKSDRIARISPETGKVVGWVHLEGLLTAEETESVDVLNGIAYDRDNQRLFVTGKLWPKLFEIEVLP